MVRQRNHPQEGSVHLMNFSSMRRVLAQSGTTSIADISRERAEELCRENGLKSFLFIEIGSERDWFHSVHMTCGRGGCFRKLREYRLAGLEKDNIYERIESHLLMKFPDLGALGVDTERKAGKNQ